MISAVPNSISEVKTAKISDVASSLPKDKWISRSPIDKKVKGNLWCVVWWAAYQDTGKVPDSTKSATVSVAQAYSIPYKDVLKILFINDKSRSLDEVINWLKENGL